MHAFRTYILPKFKQVAARSLYDSWAFGNNFPENHLTCILPVKATFCCFHWKEVMAWWNFVFLVNTEEIKTNISSVQCNMLSMNVHRYKCRHVRILSRNINSRSWLLLVPNKMLSYRREAALQGALQFSPKVEDWNWETIFYGHYRSIFNHCDIIGLKICRIPWKTQNKGYYGVQGHSRSSRSVPIESPYAISY